MRRDRTGEVIDHDDDEQPPPVPVPDSPRVPPHGVPEWEALRRRFPRKATP
jgi:hypothetical protein